MNAATDKFEHLWLQEFDLDGGAVGTPVKLEEQWGAYAEKHNWEAMDWTLDGRRLVMGFDAKKGRRVLAVFSIP